MAIETNENGRKIVRFGTGDICIGVTGEVTYDSLAFFQVDEPGKIGESTEKYNGKTIYDVNAEVIFVFSKRASIKSVIDSLNDLYEKMPNDEQEETA